MYVYTDVPTSPLWGTQHWCPPVSPFLSSLETPPSSIFKARHGQMDCLVSKMWAEVTWVKSTCSPPSTVSCEDSWYDGDTGGWGRWVRPCVLTCNHPWACSYHSIVATTKCSNNNNSSKPHRNLCLKLLRSGICYSCTSQPLRLIKGREKPAISAWNVRTCRHWRGWKGWLERCASQHTIHHPALTLTSFVVSLVSEGESCRLVAEGFRFPVFTRKRNNRA